MLDDRYNLEFRLYPYERSANQDAETPVRHPVVIVGGGPVGMALALDLGLQDVPVVVLDDHEGIGVGSRAICFAKRTLEIADRYGCAAPMLDKGVVWNTGRVFHRAGQVFEFDLLPEDGHKFPAFINLQQPYFERFLVDRIREAQAQGAPIEIRGKNRVSHVDVRGAYAALDIDTPEGPYRLKADWLIACDGASSPLRKMLGLTFDGEVFQDNFLIADIRMTAEFPTERWFWFEPDFEDAGASALLHKQPDGIWRTDFQIGWDIDRAHELKEENIRRRLNAMLGDEAEYDIVWSSIYTFECRRMRAFRHGPVLFAGDAAHQVSPFGARGANSGVQDADNLGWKLAHVLRGLAPERLIDSYEAERAYAADENVLNSTRSTDFITPKSKISHLFRNAVLDLAGRHPFARPLVNSGRLSQPSTYAQSPLTGTDALPGGPERTRPGAAAVDVGLGDGWLLGDLGNDFTLLALNTDAPERLDIDSVQVRKVSPPSNPLLVARYLGTAPTAVYLIRPDQHIAARWETYDASKVGAALRTCLGRPC